jgi:roadblock/LC7 domain-containing protein
MKPLEIRPLSQRYDPGYAAFAEIEDWQSFVAPSSKALFAPQALFFAGVLGSVFLADAGAQEMPKVGPPLKSPNAEAAKIANACLDEVKATGSWYRDTKFDKKDEVENNPKVVVPNIRISFGNSYSGIFDMVRVKKATIALFGAYGVKLKEDYPLKRGDVEFQVDGYDPEKKIGFEILGADYISTGGFSADPPDPRQSKPATDLDEKEAEKLKKIVSAGEEKMFLAPAVDYPLMDGDEYTPMRAYLQSALDYLQWLKKQGRL